MPKILPFPTPPPPEEPDLPDFTIRVGRTDYEIRKKDRAHEPPPPPKRPA